MHFFHTFSQLNPQKEIPVLDDDGFVLSESIAIMQYLCDQYDPENPIYPKEPKQRALVNHRLAFNMCFYYKYIFPYTVILLLTIELKSEKVFSKAIQFATFFFSILQIDCSTVF